MHILLARHTQSQAELPPDYPLTLDAREQAVESGCWASSDGLQYPAKRLASFVCQLKYSTLHAALEVSHMKLVSEGDVRALLLPLAYTCNPCPSALPSCIPGISLLPGLATKVGGTEI